jgi:hypothetical protein
MIKNNITPKFTLEGLRDNITSYKCGSRGQSRRFHKLDKDYAWTGEMISLKVPVVHLSIFPDEIGKSLARSKRTHGPS